ncbi:nuclear transport factor 2 family protein [Telluribacter sp. SYSU D00476]|uniref:nuclear transport factor 2 family protein n=1 Tax=Telluribacter sp. SYSU D00476 TaxID=2811430 RepID=UPI001FF21919|nr:nuclear transport factor 2 family protein [Telluribacter sp. SYSU D00476]
MIVSLLRAALVAGTIAAFTSMPVKAQTKSEESAARAVVDQLFTGMRSGDSSLVRRAFLPDASLQSVTTASDGTVKVRKDAIEGFINAIGTPHDEVWDERIYNVKVQIDGPMAIVWTPYKFYIGSKFSHCGVNAFTLVKTTEGWKIAGITDTRRRDNCL